MKVQNYLGENLYVTVTDMNLLKPRVPILNFMRFRGSRKPREVLEKPEDKSTVILGKWKPSIAYPKPGVSDKAVSLVSLFKLYTTVLLFSRTPSTLSGTDQCTYRQSILLCLETLMVWSILDSAALTSASLDSASRSPSLWRPLPRM